MLSIARHITTRPPPQTSAARSGHGSSAGGARPCGRGRREAAPVSPERLGRWSRAG